MENRTVYGATAGETIPVTVELNVQPLTESYIDQTGNLIKNAPIIRSDGKPVMNDEWIYTIVPNYGRISINVNRANYCKKIYMMQVSIIDSIGHAKVTERLQRFINIVSDKLVFIKDGVTYQVYLTKNKGKFDLKGVVIYWANCGLGGIHAPDPNNSWVDDYKPKGYTGGYVWGVVNKKYGDHVAGRGTDGAVDLKAVFNFH